MSAHWECRCGEGFPKYGFELTRHIKEGKRRGEDHGLRGLVDDETGEVLAETLPRPYIGASCLPRCQAARQIPWRAKPRVVLVGEPRVALVTESSFPGPG